MQPIVLVDMDGPLADFDAEFFAACERNGWAMDCTIEQQRHRFATDHIPDKAHRAAARAHVDSTDWFRHLPVTRGAIEGMAVLAEHADVWICSKPLEANATCRDDKAWWLAKHFGDEWARRLILAPDKSLVYGDLLLDDAPNPDWYLRCTWRPVIFPTPWNGAGSKWDDIDARWTWGDPIDVLLGVLV